jgi:hypothetical protein
MPSPAGPCTFTCQNILNQKSFNMKPCIITVLLITLFATKNFAQSGAATADAEKVILDNSKMKVTEYTSVPAGNVCGKGTHSHGPHLTVILADAEVEVMLPDGKKVTQKAPAGTTFWSEAETHAVRNIGKTPLKVEIIETKS